MPVPVAADDDVMRGGLHDPLATFAHGSRGSNLHDRNALESSRMCGTCHPASLAEWTHSVYADESFGRPLTCGGCHMEGRNGVAAAVEGAPIRRAHSHMFVGVDVAISDHPGTEEQRKLVQRELDGTLAAELCVHKTGTIAITLENLSAGHDWPSCAPHDRRAWVEVVAEDADGNVLLSSGVVPEGVPVVNAGGPNLWLMRDRLADKDGNDVTMVWNSVATESSVLPPQTPLTRDDPRYVEPHMFRTWSAGEKPARVRMAVHLRPIGLEIVDDLIASGDLDPKYKARLPTWTLAPTVIEWKEGDPICVP